MAIKTVDELAAQLKSSGYKQKTDDELRSQAENLYKNQRDQAKLTAQQSYDETAAALQNQLANLGTSYDRQIESQQQATRQGLSQADRLATSRGMGRSSYNNATQANIQLQGDKAVGRIQEDRTAAESGINSQLTQLQRQLQQNLGQADSAFETNVLAEMQRLRDQDYDRGVAADDRNNSLAFNLYNAGQEADKTAFNQGMQKEQLQLNKDQQAFAQQMQQAQFDYGKQQDALSQQNWQAQFDLNRDQQAFAQQMQQAQLDLNKDQFDWQKTSTGQDRASDIAMKLIANKKMPSAELLQEAGLSPAAAQSLIGLYSAVGGSSGSSGSGGNGGGTTPPPAAPNFGGTGAVDYGGSTMNSLLNSTGNNGKTPAVLRSPAEVEAAAKTAGVDTTKPKTSTNLSGLGTLSMAVGAKTLNDKVNSTKTTTTTKDDKKKSTAGSKARTTLNRLTT